MKTPLLSDPQTAAAMLYGDAPLAARDVHLRLGKCGLRLRSNSTELLELLAGYFAHVSVSAGDAPELEVVAIERPPVDAGVDFIDWAREPGKSGRKDAYRDLPGGRLVLKVRTGMLFLQSEDRRVAAGPCLRHPNQVINFINAQYMNWLQQRGALICHAAGLVYQGRAFGIAGFSGGGKSTLMLRLLDQDAVAYLTNDRLFIRSGAPEPQALGIPKLPRVNPGTLVHNPRLQGLLDTAERARLLALPPHELWELEDKYDVDVSRIYGPGRIVQEAPLGGFVVLNWQRDSEAAAELVQVDLAQRRELLGAIMKSPGPFYQYTDGSFFRDTTILDQEAYLDALLGVPVYEVSGGVDFPAVAELVLHNMSS